MVGLIPRTYILHIIGKTGAKPIEQNPELVRICEKEDIALISITEDKELRPIIREYRPDILLIEEDVFKSNLADPNITYHSKSCQPFKLVFAKTGQGKEQIFELFKQGADEIMTNDSSAEEIFLKFFSILRRKSILELNQLTSLPAINRTYTVLEHCRKNLSDWVAVHIDILHFQSYSLMYGVAKTDEVISETAKVLQETFAAGHSEYFVGHLGRDNFLVISNSNALDFIIEKSKRNFKKILSKLYRTADLENNYIISSAPQKVRRKEGLMDLNIGFCNSIDRNFLSGTDIIEQAVKNKKDEPVKNKKVLIMEEDEDFAALLEETLNYEGNEAKISKGVNFLLEEVEQFEPRTLILEAAKLGQKGFIDLCEKLSKFKEEFGLKIVVTTTIPGYQNFLAAGADVYIPKPYDFETVLKEVRRMRYTHS